jgi:hypothetical protein
MMGEGDRYASCKTDFVRRGYLRRPEGQESEETKQAIRDIDAVRAASIKKGEAAAQLDVPHSPEGEGSPSRERPFGLYCSTSGCFRGRRVVP